MKKETLESLLQKVVNMPSVAQAYVWTPTPEEVAEYAADGIDAKPCLEVTLWNGELNTRGVKCAIQDLGLRCIGEGSNCLGPCFSFVLEDHKSRQLHEIALEIRRDWKKPYFGALPYLDALESMDSPNANFGCDSGREIVLYFLSNATSWKGETARRIKAELKEALK